MQDEKSSGLAMPSMVWVVAALVALAVVGFGCYQAGSNSATARLEKQMAAEQEFNIALAKSEFEGLDIEEGQTIYVTGHKSPDTDTVCCAIAYARLLEKLGYKAQAVTLGPINKETAYVLDTVGVPTPEVLEDASEKYMVLVDHADYEQSANGLEDAHIVSIIDHHGVGTVSVVNPIVYDARPLGSTATIVWMRYCNFGVEIDPQTAKLLVGAILSDTVNLKNATTADKEAVKALSKIASFDNLDEFYTQMHKASLSYEGMTKEEIFLSDVKVYESAGTRFAIGCVNAYDEEAAKDLAQQMKEIMESQLVPLDVKMAFAQVSVFHDDVSINYLVPSNEAAAEVLKEAFGDRATFDGTSYVLEPGGSRKKVIMPAISNTLAEHPVE